ncbi:hypothetical protein [Hoylesella shahii]|uniref:hypothetical protein n=1 Tax=Hoylesella shahii TaxID=228603 RepID=UPI0028D0C288|nr:hypothetical protein [Hoylesella shahii]
MAKLIKNWRYHVLTTIAFIAILGLFSEPKTDNNSIEWLTEFATSKAIGAIAAYAFYRMAKRWMGNGSMPELKEISKEE